MARWAKIAIVAPKSLDLEDNLSYSQIVKRMKEHWRRQFECVLHDSPDLIVVPEVCDRPAGMNGKQAIEYYRERGNQIGELFARIAKDNSCYITYSAVRMLDDGTFRNATILFDRTGSVAGIYDKNHPTSGEIEVNILPGNNASVIECDFGRVACAICFDLNFDELRLQYVKQSPDLILFSSMYHGGDTVQGNWAYSCRAYFVGAIAPHDCPSQIRNPFGQVVASTTNYFPFTVKMINLDYCLAHLDFNWEKLNALKKKYKQEVEIYDPGLVGAVMIASNTDKSAINLAREFDIELVDEYFERSLKMQGKQ